MTTVRYKMVDNSSYTVMHWVKAYAMMVIVADE
jgi:hypothetical protein